MFKSYIKIAWRSLWKNKLFSFINIFGLALSLSVCMMVMVQVKDDLSYDQFHPFKGRIYRILSDVTENNRDKKYKLASTPLPLKYEIAQHTDIIEATVQLYPAFKGKGAYGDKELYVNGAFTEPSFFDVFSFSLSSGNKETALQLANGLVLSSETAYKFFRNVNPIGKTLDFGKLGVFQVTGVLKKPSGKSHLTFDAYASKSSLQKLEKAKVLPESQYNWNTMNNGYTYVLLKNNEFSSKLEEVLKGIASKPQLKSDDGKINFVSQPLSKITPGTDGIYNEIGRGTVWAKLLTIVGVAFIILVAACFNYTNLTIARALTRAKEVGIRKVSGARRVQIFIQYIVEAVLVALLAFVFACLILSQIKPDFDFNYQLIIGIALFTIVTGIIAGAFPAWILSAFKPSNVLKGISTQKLFGNLSLQKGLMIFQFTLSITFIIFLTAYYRQFSYLGTLNPGFDSRNILTIPYSSKDKVFSNAISQISGVEKISRSSENFGMRGSGSITVSLVKPVNGQGILSDFYFTDANIMSLHGLKIIAGSNFPENEEFVNEKYVIINEKALDVFGFKMPSSAIGETVWLNDTTEVEIKGVVKNFYDKGSARTISPLMFRNRADSFNYLNILVNGANKGNIVKQISGIWNSLNPHSPFEFEWLDEKIAKREDQSDAYSTMGFLAFITVSIASLGLLGLVVYTVEIRQKEISIRKVIGASINQLMYLLSKGYLKLLVIAGIIAMPIGYLGSFFFLQNFANRVSLGVGTLLSGFFFLLAIGLFTIISQTYRASSANPVKNLRAE